MLVPTRDDAAYMHCSLFYIRAKNKVLLEPHWEAFALTSGKKKKLMPGCFDSSGLNGDGCRSFEGNGVLTLGCLASVFPHKRGAPKGGCVLIMSDLL